ncbi:MAG TPA: sugar phosphate isomerase/epimerase family protein [Planctomycetota bacterium]|jgi:hexulose-6-phosphate isomerase
MPSSCNRRDFLVRSGAAVAAASLLGQSAQSGELTGKVKKALGIGMVGEGATVLEKFKLIKDLGFDGVELNSPGIGNKEDIKKAIDETGLGVSEIMDSVHWRDTLSHPDEAVRAKGVAGLKTAIADAKFVGATAVLLVPGVVNKDVTKEDAWKRSIKEIKTVVPFAEENGVYIGIENVWNNFLMDPADMAKYVDEIGSKWVGAFFDIGNHVKYGKSEDWVRTLGKRILRLHVKEFSKEKNFGVKIGDGDVNWPEVVKALKEVGYTGWATAEVSGGKKDALKDIADRMNKVLSLT